MGVAAYNRGSRVISAQFCRDRGCPGCSSCSDGPKPTPRPADWGAKTLAKATTHASRTLRYFRKRGYATDIDDLAGLVREYVKCGKATSREAAEAAFAEID